jgi:hypothetical protein
MNIIKFNDILMPEIGEFANEISIPIYKNMDLVGEDTMTIASFYNKHLKGKYAYWIQMRYVVSFDHMRHEGYVACEEDVNALLQREDGTWPKPYGAPALDIYMGGLMEYVDEIETDKINSTVEFRLRNKYVTDEDITVDEIKQFRTWLAMELLKMDQTELGEPKHSKFTPIEEHVLEYYASGTYDSTIKILSEFGSSDVTYTHIGSDCGCAGSNLSSLYSTSLSPLCDSITIYRKNIKLKMVEMFSNIDFWAQWSPEFIGVFKKYIDNIIQLGFVVGERDSDRFKDCTCKSNTSNIHNDILERLSMALGYIMKNDICGHKNYIYDALYDWSSQLYEFMIW